MNYTMITIMFSLIILSTISKKSYAQDLVFLCQRNESTTSAIHENIKNLMSLLSENSSNSDGFHTATTGQESDKVYGLYTCRGDVNSRSCNHCIQNVASNILINCSNTIEGIGLSDFCMVMYSNRNFFGLAQFEPTYVSFNRRNISEPDLSDINARYLLQRLIRDVPKSKEMFGVDNITRGSETRYALAQCRRDISVGDCTRCLNETVMNMMSKCCEGKLGWRIVIPSCYFRYESYHFYGPEITLQSQGKKGSNKSKIVYGITIPGASVLIILLAWCTYYKNSKKKKRKGMNRNKRQAPAESPILDIGTEFLHSFQSEETGSTDLPTIPLHVIRNTTDNFSFECKLGEGGFGPVYKATLPDGKEVAIKRLSEVSSQGLEEFKNEAILIAKLQHRNLVGLLSCCVEENEKLLVYEYMPNSSLDHHLFDKKKNAALNWQRRLSIINGIAKGLMYLHEDSRLRVIHRDLKAGNILLDHEMNPRISDFGMARIFGGDQRQGNTKRVVGTYGYMAPEYAMEGIFSVKSDVYSFGVLLLEILSGKRSSGFYIAKNGQSLLTYAWKLWKEGKGLRLMDPVLEETCVTSEFLKCIHIALLCVQEDASDRPTMSTVVLMLASENMAIPTPSHPAFYAGKMLMDQATTSTDSTEFSVNQVTFSDVIGR